MPLIVPERTIELPGHDFGMKVLDPADSQEIFNAKYPIFGSDISNKVDQIITHKLTLTNSSGVFNEPATPGISWINDGNWRTMQYNQIDNRLVATIPHGQDKVPQFMVTGFGYVRQTMRMRYWHQDQNGSMTYNSLYNAEGGFRTLDIVPRLGGVGSFLPYPTMNMLWEFRNVGPYTSSVYGNVNNTSFNITADATNIYIRATLRQNINYQRLRDTQYNFGWDRYEKYYSDLSGSWYSFTFYVLPYDKSSDIFIR